MDEQSQQLLEKVLQFHMQAATSPGRLVRAIQLFLALLCILGAFFVAKRLVVDGPPKPKATAISATAGAQVSGKPLAKPAGKSGAAAKKAEKPAKQPGAGSKGEATKSTESTSTSLSEQAPWAFAIVALLIGAFLAMGQSIGVGGADPAGAGGEDGEGNEEEGAGGAHAGPGAGGQ